MTAPTQERRSFSEAEIAELVGATYRQIDYWCRMGYLAPEFKGGSGYFRMWSDEDVGLARKMARLVRAGVVPATAARVARGETDVGHGVRIEVL